MRMWQVSPAAIHWRSQKLYYVEMKEMTGVRVLIAGSAHG